jgi:hypothetical protein
MDTHSLNGLGEDHRRQDGGEPPCEHRLARPRGAEQEQIMVTTPASPSASPELLQVPMVMAVIPQHAGRGQAFDQGVQQRLRLGIDPVQVLEHQTQGLHLALPQQHPFEPFQRPLSSLGRIKVLERVVLREGVQQLEQRGNRLLEGFIEGEHIARDLGPDRPGIVIPRDPAIALEQVEHWDIRRGLALGHRGALQHPPGLGLMGMDELVDQA